MSNILIVSRLKNVIGHLINKSQVTKYIFYEGPTQAWWDAGREIGMAGCGIREILKARCGMKICRRDSDMLRFQGEIGKRTGIGEIIIKHKLRVNRDIEKYLFPLETSFMNTPVQTGVDRPK